MHRYASTNVPIFSIAAIAYGVILLVTSPDAYHTPTFTVAFRYVPQWAWGVAFIAAGVAALAWVAFATVFALAATIVVWASFILAGTISQPGVPPSAPIWSAAIALALLVSIARRGIRPGPPTP